MNISINWQPIVGGLIMLVAVAALAFMAWKWWRNRTPSAKQSRSADAPAPPGAVEYIKDIEGALLGAPPEMILECVRTGLTRDAARSVRIQGLLKPKDPKQP